MKIFDQASLEELSIRAKRSPRLRQHCNIHQSYQDPCQRLLNAIEPNSYIRPHRHKSDPRDEMLVAVRGLMALVTFGDDGSVTGVVRLATEQYGAKACPLAELSSDVWHTVVALESGCVLLEIKAGPFDPDQPKDLALWAPEENSEEAQAYLSKLLERIEG